MSRLFVDMMGREVEISFPPKRIISLVPSQTEFLYDLGLRDEVVGITKFCLHPDEWFRNKRRVGGTKKLNAAIIDELQPDLIIANKEENTQEEIEELCKRYPVWISDIQTIPQALQMIQAVGMLANREAQANTLVDEIVAGFNQLKRPAVSKRVAYFIWYNPWMSIGGDTFISNMISAIGWKNVLLEEPRYPEIELETLRRYEPELILLSSEPFPFKDKHVVEIQRLFPAAQVQLVDGEMFSWYGSRLKKALPYLQQLIHTNQSNSEKA